MLNPIYCRTRYLQNQFEQTEQNIEIRAGCFAASQERGNKEIFWLRKRDSNPRGSLWLPNRFRVDPVMTIAVPP